MKKIFLFLALVFSGIAAMSQSAGNMSDTTQRHHGRWGNRPGADSLHQRKFNAFNRDREGAMNRFNRHGNREGSRQFGRHRFGGWNEHIHFTPEQRKQMQVINMDFHKKSADLYKKDELTLREYKSQLLALQKEKKTALQNLLTADQKNEIALQKKRAAENMQVMAAAQLERMKIRLSLSEQQAATIKSNQQKMREQMKAIHDNDNLMADQKREQMKSLAMKQKDEMKSVLTPEQLSQFENMHKHHSMSK